MTDHQQRMAAMYIQGTIPWDHTNPPPEVMTLIPTLPPGRALDLGCGPGRASIFMAQHDWHVDGVDFVPQAVEIARQRAATATVTAQTQFYVGSVTSMPYLTSAYDFALDVGCAHNFSTEALTAYHAELIRLLKPGGIYLLFAHLGQTEDDRWLWEPTLRRQFSNGFQLEQVDYGQTTVKDATWRSAWFRFKRI